MKFHYHFFFSYLKIGVFRNILMGKKALEVAGTYFNKRRKLGILDKDLGSSDVITTERVTRFTARVLRNCERIISIEYS